MFSVLFFSFHHDAAERHAPDAAAVQDGQPELLQLLAPPSGPLPAHGGHVLRPPEPAHRRPLEALVGVP